MRTVSSSFHTHITGSFRNGCKPSRTDPGSLPEAALQGTGAGTEALLLLASSTPLRLGAKSVKRRKRPNQVASVLLLSASLQMGAMIQVAPCLAVHDLHAAVRWSWCMADSSWQRFAGINKADNSNTVACTPSPHRNLHQHLCGRRNGRRGRIRSGAQHRSGDSGQPGRWRSSGNTEEEELNAGNPEGIRRHRSEHGVPGQLFL